MARILVFEQQVGRSFVAEIVVHQQVCVPVVVVVGKHAAKAEPLERQAVIGVHILEFLPAPVQQQVAFGGLGGTDNGGIVDVGEVAGKRAEVIAHVQIGKTVGVNITKTGPRAERNHLVEAVLFGRIAEHRPRAGGVARVQKEQVHGAGNSRNAARLFFALRGNGRDEQIHKAIAVHVGGSYTLRHKSPAESQARLGIHVGKSGVFTAPVAVVQVQRVVVHAAGNKQVFKPVAVHVQRTGPAAKHAFINPELMADARLGGDVFERGCRDRLRQRGEGKQEEESFVHVGGGWSCGLVVSYSAYWTRPRAEASPDAGSPASTMPSLKQITILYDGACVETGTPVRRYIASQPCAKPMPIPIHTQTPPYRRASPAVFQRKLLIFCPICLP